MSSGDNYDKGLPIEPPGSKVDLSEGFEIVGTLKWFDSAKGYGFIVPDVAIGDVLIHITTLRAGGFQTAYEGARVTAIVMRRSKGYQAFRIVAMDESTAILPQSTPPRTREVVEPESDWVYAECKWFNRQKGYGFLTQGPQTPDIFLHMEQLRRHGFTELRPGQVVQVRYGHGKNGLMVADLRPAASNLPRTN